MNGLSIGASSNVSLAYASQMLVLDLANRSSVRNMVEKIQPIADSASSSSNAGGSLPGAWSDGASTVDLYL